MVKIEGYARLGVRRGSKADRTGAGQWLMWCTVSVGERVPLPVTKLLVKHLGHDPLKFKTIYVELLILSVALVWARN
jgi:hypothetical protein